MTTLKKVLVVDDDPVVGRSFDRVLTPKGYAVITAANGDEALKKIASEEYDVVYTDIRMPGMDGIEVARRIKAGRPWLPVMIVTGFGSEENLARAKDAGVARVLHKPLSPADIEASASEAVAREVPVAAPVAEPEPVASPAPAEPEKAESEVALVAKTLGIAVAAPFVGLAYVVLFPLIGLVSLVTMGAKALFANAGRIARYVRNVALFVAAPLIGLLYTIALPFVGLGMLAWWGFKALTKRGDRVA